VPASDEWQHEIKFDGFRVQIHKSGNEVELYSRNRSRFSRRFRGSLACSANCRSGPRSSMVRSLASDAEGMPDFWRLVRRSAKPVELHVWAFDLLALDRKELRSAPGSLAVPSEPV
jgi:bifunctional non-homologous end joining protein LigD